MPLSHQLPYYWALIPTYDRNLIQIARFLHETKKPVVAIDVGANIGDTAALLSAAVTCRVMCLEGDAHYFKYLKQNTAAMSDWVVRENVLCGASPTVAQLAVDRHGGTAAFVEGNSANEVDQYNVTTIDQICERHAEFIHPDLIKIDTDGMDFQVLRGAHQTITRSQPLLFFEWDKAHLARQGEDPLSIFPFLSQLGYENILLYDNSGRARKVIVTADQSGLRESLAEIDGNLLYYYDVLAFHRSQAERFKVFCRRELQSKGMMHATA